MTANRQSTKQFSDEKWMNAKQVITEYFVNDTPRKNIQYDKEADQHRVQTTDKSNILFGLTKAQL